MSIIKKSPKTELLYLLLNGRNLKLLLLYSSIHPFPVAIVFCAVVSFARFFDPILHVSPDTPEASAFNNDCKLPTVSFGQPFIAMSTLIVPTNATSSSAAHDTNVESICERTLLKLSIPPMRRRLLHP